MNIMVIIIIIHIMATITMINVHILAIITTRIMAIIIINIITLINFMVYKKFMVIIINNYFTFN